MAEDLACNTSERESPAVGEICLLSLWLSLKEVLVASNNLKLQAQLKDPDKDDAQEHSCPNKPRESACLFSHFL